MKNKLIKIKKALIFILIISLSILSISIENVKADDEGDETISYEDFGIYVSSGVYNVNEMVKQYRFIENKTGGHGFAAEEGNNLIDKLMGRDAHIVGYDNQANGADRIISNNDGSIVLIQDKYYSTPQKSIDACFDDKGNFKYVSNNNLMQIEVASDQYDEAVKYLRSKIEKGEMGSIIDPDEAKNIVRKGHLTYKQAVNLTKAGTIDSLKYDAVNGCVVATTAFGISTTLDYVIRIHNGEKSSIALKESVLCGLKTGAKAFAISVISSQLGKTAIVNIYAPGAEALVNTFGDDFAKALINAAGTQVIDNNVTKTAVNFLKNQALQSTVVVVVLTLPDVVDLIRGRISVKQLLKDFAVVSVGTIGGTVGYLAGSAIGTTISPGIGSKIGGAVGGLVGGTAVGFGAEVVANLIYEGDAEEMIKIIQDEFYNLSIDYLTTEKEADEIAEQLAGKLKGDVLKDMFASKDRNQYAKNLMMPLFEDRLLYRKQINIPTSEEMRYELINQTKGVVYLH